MAGRAATDRVIRGRFAISVNDPGHPTPKGWQRVLLTDVAELGTGHTPSRSVPRYWDGEVAWIGIRDAGAHHGGVIDDTAQHITEKGLENSAARLLPAGTVCLSRTASVGYVVKMGRAMATSQDFVNWTCSAALEPDFLMRALLAEGAEIRQFGEGSTHTTIYFPEVKAFHIDLPPLAEQRRIVAKLDTLTAHLARARAELDRVPALAEHLRDAALKAAFAVNAPEVSVEQVSLRVTKGSSPRWQGYDYQSDGIVFVRSQNVLWGNLALDEKVYLPATFNQKAKNSVIQEGDVLLNIVGASIGRAAVATRELVGANCNQAVCIIRPQSFGDAKYLMFFMISPEAQGAILDGCVDVARANFSLAQAKSLRLPWPDELSRMAIVTKIETAFARADRMEAEAIRARALLDRLEAAVLAKAFRGELVLQDPTDEPATTLLARIRAQRAHAPIARRGRKPKAG